jgi:hypothetical protein
MSETTYIDMTEKMLKHKQPTFHYLCINAFEYRSGDDLHALMKAMDKEKHTYWVWYVPGEDTATYEINFYQPQQPGSFVLAQVEKKQRK